MGFRGQGTEGHRSPSPYIVQRRGGAGSNLFSKTLSNCPVAAGDSQPHVISDKRDQYCRLDKFAIKSVKQASYRVYWSIDVCNLGVATPLYMMKPRDACYKWLLLLQITLSITGKELSNILLKG